MVNPTSKIILKSPDNAYWQINVNEEGSIGCSLVSSLPAINAKIQNGDLIIDEAKRGIILRSPGNICFLTNISNLGSLIAIPANCLP